MSISNTDKLRMRLAELTSALFLPITTGFFLLVDLAKIERGSSKKVRPSSDRRDSGRHLDSGASHISQNQAVSSGSHERLQDGNMPVAMKGGG